MQYCQNPDSDTPIITLDGFIGVDEETGQGVNCSVFAAELMELASTPGKRPCMWINSPGGNVQDGYNIATVMLKSPNKVDTLCTGMAASMAAVLFQLGATRTMMDYGILMYHNPYAGDDKESPLINSMKESLNTIVSQRSGMAPDAVQLMMDAETFLSADEAFNKKLCDRVEETAGLNKKRLSKADNALSYWRDSQKVMNSLLDQKINFKMKRVTAVLNLTDDANESSIVEAITAVVNAKKVTQEQLDKMKADYDSMKAAFEKAKNDLDASAKACKDAEDALAAVKNDADMAEDKAKEEKAKALVTAAITSGKINGNDPKVVAKLTADAKADFEGTQLVLNAVHVNKRAVKFITTSASTVQNHYQAHSIAGEVARKQEEIRARDKR